MAGIKECDAVFVPLFSILAAQILRPVTLRDFPGDLHFDIHDFGNALAREVHKAAFFLKTEDLFNDGYGFRLVKKAQDGGLYLLHDVPAGHVSGMHVREKKGNMFSAFGLFEKLEGSR